MRGVPPLRIAVPEGLSLRDPAGVYFDAGRHEVPRSSFWLRRIADGSVTEAAAEPKELPPELDLDAAESSPRKSTARRSRPTEDE